MPETEAELTELFDKEPESEYLDLEVERQRQRQKVEEEEEEEEEVSIETDPHSLLQHHRTPPEQEDWQTRVQNCCSKPWLAYHWLWISHALGQWSDRLWSFAVPLVIATYFPSSMFPSTFYPFCSSLASFLLGPLVGRYIDGNERLWVVRITLIIQNSLVVVSSLFLILIGSFANAYALPSNPLFYVYFLFMTLFGVCSELCSLANSIAITKDWTIHVARHDSQPLDQLNAIMKRIDLTCGIVAPLVFGLILDFSTPRVGIGFVAVWNLLSLVPEYLLQVRIYHSVPSLQTPSEAPPKENPLRVLLRGWSSYSSHIVLGPSLTYVLLFVTVLSGGVQVSSYLVTQGVSTTVIALFRGGVSIMGVLSTFVVVPISRSLGNVRAGLVFLILQLLFLLGSVAAFFFSENYSSFGALYVFLAGIVLSRVGLWGYDLVEVQLLQLLVEEGQRGLINGTESSLTQLAWLVILVLGLILHHPAQFGWLVMISLDTVAMASIIYLVWWKRTLKGRNSLDQHDLEWVEM